jgi:hypothetical protein
MITDKDGKPGLRLETAASVTIRDTMRDHLQTFTPVIIRDHAVGKSVHAEYLNGLAGVIALLVVGRHVGKEDVFNATVAKLREYVDRDLQYMTGRKP